MRGAIRAGWTWVVDADIESCFDRLTHDRILACLRERISDRKVLDSSGRRHQVAVGQFYGWEKQARQGALAALRNGKRGRKPAKTEADLQAEITRLRAVVAELSVETLALKKGHWP